MNNNDCFKVTWHIRNFLMFPCKIQSELLSPPFRIDMFGKSDLILELRLTPNSSLGIETFWFELVCINAANIDLERKHVVTFNVSHALEKRIESMFTNQSIQTGLFHINEILRDKHCFLPNGTLTVTCLISCQVKTLPEDGVNKEIESAIDWEYVPKRYPEHLKEFRMETVIVTQTRIVSWSITGFTSLSVEDKLTFPVLSGVKNNPSFYVTLYRVDSSSVVGIEIRKKADDENVDSLIWCVASVFAPTESKSIAASASTSSKSNRSTVSSSQSNARDESKCKATMCTTSAFPFSRSIASMLDPAETNASADANNKTYTFTTKHGNHSASTHRIASYGPVCEAPLSTACSTTSRQNFNSALIDPISKSTVYEGEGYCWFSTGNTWEFPGFLNAEVMEKDKYFEKTGGALHIQFKFVVSVEGNSRYSEVHRTDVIHSSITHSSFVDTSGLICTEDELSDVTLRAGPRDIKAQKSVLMGRSKVFNSMFRSEMRERGTGIVEIEDISPDMLEMMVSFLHSRNRLDRMSVEDVVRLYRAADKYEVPSLMDHCVYLLAKALEVGNVCRVLEFAEEYHLDWLKERATDYVVGNEDRVLLSREWMKFMNTNAFLSASIMHKLILKKDWGVYF